VPNAWAIPGHVVITRGLLAGLDNEAEFIFVMGHEMGHVAARHSARQMSYGILQQVGLGAAGLALQGKEYSDLALGVGAIGSGLLLLKYGRDDELEADRLGIQYMAKLGYDPRQAVSAHRNLEKVAHEYMQSVGKDPQERGFFEDLLSTHPRTSVRIDELQSIIDRMQPHQVSGDGMFRQRYQGMIADLKGTNTIYRELYDKAVAAFQNKKLDEAETLVSRAISADQGQPAFHSLKGFIRLRKREYADAEKYFDEALRRDNGYAPAYRGKGTSLYFRERYSEGIDSLKKSLSLYPQDALSHYFIGLSYYKLKNYRSAIPHLQKFAEAKQQHPEIHGVLGICHENAGDLSSAYNEYVLQVRVAPYNEMGRHAASRVTDLKPRFEKKNR
jgi:predicted Zn-dependent protease